MEYEVNQFIKIDETGEIGQIKEIIYHSADPGKSRYRVATLKNESGELLLESKITQLYEEDKDDWEEVERMCHTSHTFCEMATLKWGFCSIKLAVFSDEGMIPHFHFFKGIAPEKAIPKDKINEGGCICFESANYFTHGGHKETLKRHECEELVKFLKLPCKNNKKLTNWEMLLSIWNLENDDPKKEILEDLPIPEYKHDMLTIQEEKKNKKKED